MSHALRLQLQGDLLGSAVRERVQIDSLTVRPPDASPKIIFIFVSIVRVSFIHARIDCSKNLPRCVNLRTTERLPRWFGERPGKKKDDPESEDEEPPAQDDSGPLDELELLPPEIDDAEQEEEEEYEEEEEEE